MTSTALHRGLPHDRFGASALAGVAAADSGRSNRGAGSKRNSSPGTTSAKQDEDTPPPVPAAEDSPAPAPVRRSSRSRNQAVRAGFVDSSYLHYDDIFVQGSFLPGVDDGDEDDDDASVGPKFQVSHIPAWRPRPAQPTAAEAKFLKAARLYPPPDEGDGDGDDADVVRGRRRAASARQRDQGSVCEQARDEFLALYKATVPKDRASLLASTVAGLDAQMGPQLVKVLGLDLLGSKYAATWQPQEELLFCVAMCDKYRMFKHMRRLYVKTRSVHELNGYYHNVWKTRSTELADEFLDLREQTAGENAFWEFEEKVRQRLALIWDPARCGELPVSAAGPAPLRTRTVKVTKLLPFMTAPRPLGRPPANANAAQLKGVGMQASNRQRFSSSAGGRGGASRAAGSRSVDLADPALLAALPAEPAACSGVTPRTGTLFLSRSPSGGAKLEPGVTQFALAGQAAQPQQEQQQPQQQPPAMLLLPLKQGWIKPELSSGSRGGGSQQPMAPLLVTSPNGLLLPLVQQHAASTPQPAAPMPALQHTPGSSAATTPAAAAGPDAAAAAVAAAGAGAGGGGDSGIGSYVGGASLPRPAALQQLPEMPTLPDMHPPTGNDPQALRAWLCTLSDCRTALAEFKQQVQQQTDLAVQDAQACIAAAERQRQQAEEAADRYLQGLAQQEAQASSRLQAQQEQQGQLEHSEQPLTCSEQLHLQHHTPPQQGPSNGAADTAPAAGSQQVSLSNLTSAVQQLLQQQQQQAAHKPKPAKRFTVSWCHFGNKQQQSEVSQLSGPGAAAAPPFTASGAAAGSGKRPFTQLLHQEQQQQQQEGPKKQRPAAVLDD